MSNTSGDGGGSFSSGNTHEVLQQQQQQLFNDHELNGLDLVVPSSTTTTTYCTDGSTFQQQQQQSQPPVLKKRRNLPGTPDPSAEVIALSPKTLTAKNRFVCEICSKGFQRDQNLQLHKRGHNLPWKLKQRTSSDIRKRVYVCPEPSCVHHSADRALGDLTGIKKHFSRKHGEKKWKCEKCSKKYAVQSDWKAHSKICGTKEYKCDCGTIFSRRDSFITHRAFCDVVEENNKANQGSLLAHHTLDNMQGQAPNLMPPVPTHNIANTTTISISEFTHQDTKDTINPLQQMPLTSTPHLGASSPSGFSGPAPTMSATALLQKAAQMGATTSNGNAMNSNPMVSSMAPLSFHGMPQHHSGSSDQSQLARFIDGFARSQFIQDGARESFQSGYFDHNGFLNQTHGLLKKIEEHDNMNSNGNSTLTLDFLGIGGMRRRKFPQEQQGIESEAISGQQKIQRSSDYQEEEICSVQESILEKQMWNV